MTNEKVIKALKSMRTYCSSTQLEELDYAIKVLEKLDMEGISNPLETDFSKIKEEEKK